MPPIPSCCQPTDIKLSEIFARATQVNLQRVLRGAVRDNDNPSHTIPGICDRHPGLLRRFLCPCSVTSRKLQHWEVLRTSDKPSGEAANSVRFMNSISPCRHASLMLHIGVLPKSTLAPYYVSAALQTSSKLRGRLVHDYGTNLHR